MPFSIDDDLPFGLAANSGTVRIVERKSGQKPHAATLILGDAGSMNDSRKFAENLKDYLNGDPLRYRFGMKGRRMQYEITGDRDRVNFKYNEHEKNGMSKGNGALAFILEIEPAYRDQILKKVDDAAFAVIPESGTKLERRGELRTSRSHKPGPLNPNL
ncbi:MAG TPA: hypothetical protein VIN59_00110 [Alphaproteobacteria bacterium]